MALPSSPPSRPTSDSPEFEFNPSFPSPTSLHSADQLFFRGLLLPLPLPLPNSTRHPQPPPISSDPPPPPTDPSPSILSAGAPPSKRWRHVFNKSDKKPSPNEEKDKRKDPRKTAELKINLWPFSRSRSAGSNSAARTISATGRKVSSAPCSRSNSSGESKSRRHWPTSPARAGGVHLARPGPVWQLPRTSSGRAPPEVNRRRKSVKYAGDKTNGRVLSLPVPMCIGYRNQLSCRSGEASAVGIGDGATEVAGGGSRIAGTGSGNLFGLRSLFSKKVY